MAGSLWRRALRRAVAVLLYFGGIFLFFLIGFDIYTSPPEGSMANASRSHVGPLLLCVVLIVVGAILNQRMGPRAGSARAGPDHVGFDHLGGAPRTGARGDANQAETGYGRQRTAAPDPNHTRCPQCGMQNKRGYRYCGHCAGKLSG